jgi:hypothetical protein
MEINNLPNFDSSEKEIQDDFLLRIAQMGADEESLNGETPEDMAPLQEQDPNAMGDEAMLDTEDGSDQISDIMDSPDKEKVDTLNWDNFTVVMNEDYGTMLAEEQGLDLQDALDKSHYIRYKTPEELLALQGTLFGKDSAEGEGLIELGGYDSQENLEKQLEMLQSDQYFEGGIPEEKKDELLVPLDELSSAFENYKDSKEEDKAERKVDELENPAEVEKDEDEMLELPENIALEEAPQTPEAPAAASKGSKMSPTIPKPTGKANLSTEQRLTKRSVRLDRLNVIK